MDIVSALTELESIFKMYRPALEERVGLLNSLVPEGEERVFSLQEVSDSYIYDPDHVVCVVQAVAVTCVVWHQVTVRKHFLWWRWQRQTKVPIIKISIGFSVEINKRGRWHGSITCPPELRPELESLYRALSEKTKPLSELIEWSR
jgi:hypothetical protein